MVLLKHKKNLKKFVVASTHIHWNPALDYVKMCQAFYLLKNIQEFLEDNEVENAPVIICGDFNSDPSSSVFHFMNNMEYTLTD